MIDLDISEDGRVYLSVGIFDKKFYSLLDSGATVSVIGARGWARLKTFDKELKLKKCKFSGIRVANGVICTTLGQVDVPVEIEGVKKRVRL